MKIHTIKDARLCVCSATEFHPESVEIRHQQTARMVFLDPPFNIGKQYKGFRDRQPKTVFEDMIIESISVAMEWADPNGSVICLHGPDDLAEIYLDSMRSLAELKNKPFTRIAWINWHYNFGENQVHKWTEARCHCLVYAIGGNRWNPENIMIPSTRLLTGDKRVEKSKYKGMRVPGNVWGIPADGPNWGRVQGNNQERWKHSPNQLPLKYLARLIRAYTLEDDLVVDLFCGSGTTALASNALGRRSFTCDISEATIDSAAERLVAHASIAAELC